MHMTAYLAWLQVAHAAHLQCYKGSGRCCVAKQQCAPLSPGIMVGSATVIFRKPRVFVGW